MNSDIGFGDFEVILVVQKMIASMLSIASASPAMIFRAKAPENRIPLKKLRLTRPVRNGTLRPEFRSWTISEFLDYRGAWMRSIFLLFTTLALSCAPTVLTAQDNSGTNGSGQQPPASPPQAPPPTQFDADTSGFNPTNSAFNPPKLLEQENNPASGGNNAPPRQEVEGTTNQSGQQFSPLSSLRRLSQSSAGTQAPTGTQDNNLQGSNVKPYVMQSSGTITPAQPTDASSFQNYQQHQANNGQGQSSYNPSGNPNGSRISEYENGSGFDNTLGGSAMIKPAGHTEPANQQDQNSFGGGGFGGNSQSGNSVLQRQYGAQTEQYGSSTSQYDRQNTAMGTQGSYGTDQFNNNTNSNSTGNLQQLLREFDVLSVQGELPGQPKTLIEIIAASPMHRHSQVASAYWDLFNAWAKWRRANDWASRLHAINEPQALAERTLLAAARSAGLNEVKQAEHELRNSQSRLAGMVPSLPNSSRILPADLPLVGEYITRYDHFASIRQMDPQSEQIHQQLPEMRSLIKNQADTVVQFNQAYVQVMQGYANGQMSVSSALETIRLAREQDQKLVDSITQYNKNIAQYAFYVAPGAQSPENIVKMLIKPSAKSIEIARQAGLVQSDPNIRQATLTEPNYQNQYSNPPSTNSFVPPAGMQNIR
jgi:hypothetical protein